MFTVRVFSGSDVALVDQAVSEAVKAAVGEMNPDFSLLTLEESDYETDDGYSLAPLINALSSVPMFEPRQVVLARHLGQFTTKAQVAPLVEALKDPSTTVDLIMVWEKGPANKKRSISMPKSLLEALAAHGARAESTDVDLRSAPRFVENQIRLSGLAISRAAVAEIAEHLKGDVSRLDPLLNALKSAFPNAESVSARGGRSVQQIDVGEVKPFLGDPSDVPPWDLTDAISSGNIVKSLEVLNRMTVGGSRHPLQVMATLTSHYSMMASLDGAAVRNERDAQEFLARKGSTFPLKKAMQHARQLGSSKLKANWHLLAQADLDLRGGGVDANQTVEVLVARLAAASRS